MRITCEICKEEVDVSMYFYDTRVDKAQFLPSDPILYRAVTNGRAICPSCGADISKTFSSFISSRDIVRLAIGEGGAE